MALSKLNLSATEELLNCYRPPGQDLAARRKEVMILVDDVGMNQRHEILNETADRVIPHEVTLREGTEREAKVFFLMCGLHLIASDTKNFKEFSTRVCLRQGCHDYPTQLNFTCRGCEYPNPVLTKEEDRRYRDAARARAKQLMDRFVVEGGPIPIINDPVAEDKPQTEEDSESPSVSQGSSKPKPPKPKTGKKKPTPKPAAPKKA